MILTFWSGLKIGFDSGRMDTTDNKLYIENSDSSEPLIYGDFEKDSLHFHGKTGTESIHLTDTTSSPQLGSFYNKSAPIAYAVVAGDGSILTKFGIYMTRRIGTGHYKITIQNATSTPPVVLTTVLGTFAHESFSTSYQASADDEIIVFIQDEDGNSIDRQFSLFVMGW